MVINITTLTRYIYIERSDWLHRKFPNPNVLSLISAVTVFVLYAAFLTPITIAALLLGE